MGLYRNWASVVRRKFMKSTSQKTIIVLHTSNIPEEDVKEEREKDESLDDFQKINNIESQLDKKELSKEDLAAIKIQAYFRRHLAKRAFRALRSLVKLQALVRGVHVRRQARVALHCMHALVRLQVRVRARQLLSKSGHGDY